MTRGRLPGQSETFWAKLPYPKIGDMCQVSVRKLPTYHGRTSGGESPDAE